MLLIKSLEIFNVGWGYLSVNSCHKNIKSNKLINNFIWKLSYDKTINNLKGGEKKSSSSKVRRILSFTEDLHQCWQNTLLEVFSLKSQPVLQMKCRYWFVTRWLRNRMKPAKTHTFVLLNVSKWKISTKNLQFSRDCMKQLNFLHAFNRKLHFIH